MLPIIARIVAAWIRANAGNRRHDLPLTAVGDDVGDFAVQRLHVLLEQFEFDNELVLLEGQSP